MVAMATYSSHRLTMGKVEISIFFLSQWRYLDFFMEMFIEQSSMFHITSRTRAELFRFEYLIINENTFKLLRTFGHCTEDSPSKARLFRKRLNVCILLNVFQASKGLYTVQRHY